jgi:hypothetical protein
VGIWRSCAVWWHWTCWFRGNTLVFYLGSAWFESQPGHQYMVSVLKHKLNNPWKNWSLPAMSRLDKQY